ncbi:MAG: hypothetical protein WCO31_08305 [Actinomycetes bacterium]
MAEELFRRFSDASTVAGTIMIKRVRRNTERLITIPWALGQSVIKQFAGHPEQGDDEETTALQ